MKFAPMVLLVGALFGQQENATVSGKAVNATTSAPVAGATMTLRRMDFVSPGTAEYSATADAEGKFEFGPVTPGRYRLTGTHTGYVPTTYGARTPRGEGKLLTVGPNAEISWVRMELLPLSTIAGRVVDADGNPARDVQVTVAAVLYPLGTKQYLAARAARSNERGEYRIAGLSPGRYLLMARAPGEPPTYYPGGGGRARGGGVRGRRGANHRRDERETGSRRGCVREGESLRTDAIRDGVPHPAQCGR